MTLVLRRTATPGTYKTAGVPLCISGDRIHGWRIAYYGLLSDEFEAWLHRNSPLIRLSFPTLRDVRQTLDAAFCVDPPPRQEERVVPLRRTDDPALRVTADGAWHVTRHDSSWIIRHVATGETVAHVPSLRAAARFIAVCQQRHADSHPSSRDR